MNDSGYCSPGFSKEEPNSFFLRKKRSDPIAETVFYENDEILGAVALRKVPEMDLNKTLFYAKLRDYVGERVWVPFNLPCNKIQPKTEVEWVAKSVEIYDTTLLKQEKDLTKSSGSSVFLIERKYRNVITLVDNKTIGYDCKIGVVTSPDETFKEALKKDGRFKDIENFVLNEKNEGGKGSKVEINDKTNRSCKLTLQVSVKRTANSSHSKPSSPISLESSSNVATVQKKSSQLTNKKLEQLVKKLREKKVVYIFPESPDNLADEELLSAMEQCFQSRFQGALFRSKERQERELKKAVGMLAKVHFAKFSETGRPVSFSKKMHNFFDSVGYVRCGTVEASCFLVSDAMIATNFHVAKLLHSQSHSSDAFVFFNYEEKGQKSSLSNGHKLRPLSYKENVMSKEFDYAFLFLENPVENPLTLGQFVRCKSPEVGNLCIIGHPNGDPKHDDIFPILLPHELDNRLAEKRHEYELNDPSFYMCRNDIRDIYRNPSLLSYDVGCMFEGSSGSPVFDMDFNIVALHTLGYHMGTRRFMEVGVKFISIIHDLEIRGFSEFVNEQFPYCKCENMET